MKLVEVIRKYRKIKNMTQTEMANRLGITASAVNKWENGNSFPDITLLSPIAKLLNISLDTLLSFQEELTSQDIHKIILKVDALLKEKSYEQAFQWAKKKLEEYPNCEQLIWQIAIIFEAQLRIQEISDSQKYDTYFHALYIQLLQSSNETIRSHAADALFNFYMRKKQYEKAEECLDYFSKQNPERKRKQAEVYSKTNQIDKAYKTYEELLFSYYGMISITIHGIYMLAINENNLKKVHMLADKQKEFAKCFEMGKYYEVSSQLEIATLEKDADTIITTMREMLASIEQIHSFCQSPLYEHMKFQEVKTEFIKELKENLFKCFCDEESYGFLKEDKRWQEFKNASLLQF